MIWLPFVALVITYAYRHVKLWDAITYLYSIIEQTMPLNTTRQSTTVPVATMTCVSLKHHIIHDRRYYVHYSRAKRHLYTVQL